jgi:hypothetical protein
VASWIAIALGVVVLLFGVAQIALPPIAENRVADRLTENGGKADVSISSFPAPRLFFRHGDELRVTGSGLELELSEEGGGLTDLDGFGDVAVELTDFITGPFRMSRFDLERTGDDPYRIEIVARTTGADMIEQAGEQLGFIGSGLLGAIARQAPLTNQEFGIEVSVELASEDGELRVVSGGGRVAGYPVGPIATAITAAIASQLDITP